MSLPKMCMCFAHNIHAGCMKLLGYDVKLHVKDCLMQNENNCPIYKLKNSFGAFLLPKYRNIILFQDLLITRHTKSRFKVSEPLYRLIQGHVCWPRQQNKLRLQFAIVAQDSLHVCYSSTEKTAMCSFLWYLNIKQKLTP